VAKHGSLRRTGRGRGGVLWVAVDTVRLRQSRLYHGGPGKLAVPPALHRNLGLCCGEDGDVAVERRRSRWSIFSIPPGAAPRRSGSGCGGGRAVAVKKDRCIGGRDVAAGEPLWMDGSRLVFAAYGGCGVPGPRPLSSRSGKGWPLE